MKWSNFLTGLLISLTSQLAVEERSKIFTMDDFMMTFNVDIELWRKISAV